MESSEREREIIRLSYSRFTHQISFAVSILNFISVIFIRYFVCFITLQEVKSAYDKDLSFPKEKQKKCREQGSVTLSSQVLPVFKNRDLVW